MYVHVYNNNYYTITNNIEYSKMSIQNLYEI